MKKIVINLFSKRMEENDFERYTILKFQDFEVLNFHFDLQEMFVDIVGAIIEHLKIKENIKIEDTIIVLQTNVPDLGHFSAKFYSQALDQVIIIPNKNEFIENVSKEYSFVKKINSKAISSRIPKVYVHELESISMEYLIFLHDNMLFNEVELFKETEINTSPKMQFELQFTSNSFIIETNLGASEVQTVYIENVGVDNEMDMTKLFESENAYGQYLITKLAIETEQMNKQRKNLYLVKVVEKAQQFKCEVPLIKLIQNYINEQQISIENFIDYIFICMSLGNQDGLTTIFNKLKEDKNKIDVKVLHSIITNSLFYITKLNQTLTASTVQIRLQLMKELKQFWKKQLRFNVPIEKNENTIAIIAGQLLAYGHSPTKLAIDHANMLKKYSENLKVKIFVEDWANYSPDELTWINGFSSATAVECKDIHQHYLNSDIEVYYSDANLNRQRRLQQDIEAIIQYNPSVIYKIGSRYNIATDILYDYYPVISQTLGGIEDSYFVDIFTGGNTNDDMYAMYKQYNIENQTYTYHHPGMQFSSSGVTPNRNDYHLTAEDFILVTVGNRLSAEMDEQFINIMLNIIRQNQDIKWILLGDTNSPLIKEKCKEFINSGQIILHGYEADLINFYKMCNVYVNPIRKSGGYSAAAAMHAGLPIITSDDTSDVGIYVGKENCINVGYFESEIMKLKTNVDYYTEKCTEMKFKIENEFSFKKTVEDFKYIFTLANEKYLKRIED